MNTHISRFLLLAFLLLSWQGFAQELNCNVIINDKQVQTQERQIIEQMRTGIAQFMNNTRWTNDEFKQNERIKCTIYITLLENNNDPNKDTDVSQGKYAATVQIQSSRPVYGTNYESTMLNFFDQYFYYEYSPSQPLTYTENVFVNNLTSLLSFYAYTIIALDYDSFASKGGAPYYDKVLNITNTAAQASPLSWNTNDTRSRYWLAQNLNSAPAAAVREGLYLYHRQAMDVFATDPEAAKKKIIEMLERMKIFRQSNPTAVLVKMFFDAKSTELLGVFSQGDPETTKKAVALLTQLDPENSVKYNALVK